MKTQVTKTLWDGQKFIQSEQNFHSLESAHGEHKEYNQQQTDEDIESLDWTVPYLHLVEFRDGEYHQDLYFTKAV